MIDVVNKKSYRLDDEVYFILNSVDKPHLYIRCKGKIIQKHSKKDNVIYLIQLKKLFVDANDAKTHLHRRTFRARKIDTNVAVMKQIYCLEFLDQPEYLSSNICELLQNYLFVIPSVFVTDDNDELQTLYENAKDTITQKLRQFLLEIENSN